ncbi:hypothetical protein TRIUR3_13111 [Triticum urartu]|uniref:Uncharacterized protein n=1 Tax=Triticum urartu TaxID=4572 RepID=M7YTT7_TRIUA|nr:hypothetical protein TRIUR3_13111 [Triticum urartu]
MSSASSSQFPASTERESTTANDNAIPHDPGADSAGPAQSRLSLQLDQRSLHFSVNAWVLIVALIGIIPLATRQLQLKGYRLSLLGTTCTTGYAIFALYGVSNMKLSVETTQCYANIHVLAGYWPGRRRGDVPRRQSGLRGRRTQGRSIGIRLVYVLFGFSSWPSPIT